MVVPKFQQTIDKALKKFRTLMRILQDADKLVIFTVVKGEDNSEDILKRSDIPNIVTKLRRYLDRLFPSAESGNLNPGIWIAFDNDQKSLQEQMR